MSDTPRCDVCGHFTTNPERYSRWQPTPWNGPNVERLCKQCEQAELDRQENE